MAALGASVLAHAPDAAADDPTSNAAAAQDIPQEVKDAQYGFLVVLGKCTNCGECVEACRIWSWTPENGPARRKVTSYLNGIGREYFVTTSCMHCNEPACATVCPAGAISKGDGGIVTVNKDVCIGCKYCYQACPYDATHYLSTGMDKCDYCVENGVPLGEKPRCVRACKMNALHYGTVEELEAFKGAKRLEGPTDPNFYLV